MESTREERHPEALGADSPRPAKVSAEPTNLSTRGSGDGAHNASAVTRHPPMGVHSGSAPIPVRDICGVATASDPSWIRPRDE